ncbi:hypothetical protein J4G37_04680 [Microvirga sp. 3-52]|nr:hypothetical protein [Microvirga sp. 3-52]
MTILDPISGKQVTIDLSGKPRNPLGDVCSAEESSRRRWDGSVDCESGPHAGRGIRSHERLGG